MNKFDELPVGDKNDLAAGIKAMPPAIVDQWLAALRSGDYTQTYRYMHNSGDEAFNEPAGHCCLGVLQKEMVGDVERYPSGKSQGLPTYRWVKDKFPNGCEQVGNAFEVLWPLNDSHEYTFEDIANIIEASRTYEVDNTESS